MTQASEGGLSPLDEAGIEKVIAAALAAVAASGTLAALKRPAQPTPVTPLSWY